MGPFCAIVQLNEYFAVSVRGFGLGVRSMPVGCLMGNVVVDVRLMVEEDLSFLPSFLPSFLHAIPGGLRHVRPLMFAEPV